MPASTRGSGLVVSGGVAGLTVPGIISGGGSGGAVARPPWGASTTVFDSQVNSTSAIQSAAASSANAGKVIAIRGGTYGRLALSGGAGHPPDPFGPAGGKVTFIPFPGETVTIPGYVARWTQNIRFEGMVWTDSVDIQAAEDFSAPNNDPGAAFHNKGLEVYGCDFQIPDTLAGIKFAGYTDSVLVQGCKFSASVGSVTGDNGYAIINTGGAYHNTGLTIKQCLFDGVGNDCIQLSSISTVLIDRCEFLNRFRFNSSDHPDATQFDGVSSWQITNCKYGPQPGNIEQVIFMSFQNDGGLIQNTVVFDSTTLGISWSSHTPSDTAQDINLIGNTVWNTAGVQFQNVQAGGHLNLLNNLFDHGVATDDPTLIGTNTGNQIGGSPNFDADLQSLAFSQGYRKPSGVWW